MFCISLKSQSSFFAVELENLKTSTHVFNTLTLSFRSQKYYRLPVLTWLKQLWSPPREFGPQIQFLKLT